MQKKQKHIYIHLTAWISVVVLYIWSVTPSLSQLPLESSSALIAQVLVKLPVIFVVFYAFYLFIAPLSLTTRRWFLFLSALIVLWPLTALFHWLSVHYFNALATELVFEFLTKVSVNADKMGPFIVAHSLSSTDLLLGVYFAVLLSSMIVLLRQQDIKEKEYALIEKERVNSELKFLRGQIQPHFLMNTLNNIYGMVLPASEAAAETLAKLSDLMRYMLYESSQQYIALSSEVEMFKAYIELEKVRLDDGFTYNLNIEGHIDSIEIPPTLLIVFIENSFKHGGFEYEEQSWLDVNLSVMGNKLIFSVENSVIEIQQKESASGIGLSNVRRRLELYYGSQYVLKVHNEADSYLCRLEIELKYD